MEMHSAVRHVTLVVLHNTRKARQCRQACDNNTKGGSSGAMRLRKSVLL